MTLNKLGTFRTFQEFRNQEIELREKQVEVSNFSPSHRDEVFLPSPDLPTFGDVK